MFAFHQQQDRKPKNAVPTAKATIWAKTYQLFSLIHIVNQSLYNNVRNLGQSMCVLHPC